MDTTYAFSTISIHNLAVLRAAVEGVHLGTYFGSWASLRLWIEDTHGLGWIDLDGQPSNTGLTLAAKLPFATQGHGRAYLWPDSDALVAMANEAIEQKSA